MITTNKAILFTRPNHDEPTAALHYFSGEVIENIKNVDEFSIIDLEGQKANRKNVEKGLNKTNLRLVVLNGHGSKNSVCGNGYDEIILDEKNIRLLNAKIIYAAACDSSEELGELAINKGNADAYIGYESKFMVIIDPTRSATPSKDKNLKIFIKPYAALILSLISGRSVQDSIDETKRTLKELIREYGVYGIRDQYGDAPLIRFALYWDLFFLKGHGKMYSTI